jgi:splicing factor 3B subunit 4
VGANLFIGNLDPDVDEKLLYDTFSAFGVIVNAPKVMRDPETGISRGFGFISFADFDSSDAAVEAMNGQFLMNRAIAVTYAFKKDTKGERHGTPAERLLASQRRSKASGSFRPHTLFATGPRQRPQGGMEVEVPPQVAMAASGFAAGMPMPPPPPVGAGMPGMMPPPMHGGIPPPPWAMGGGGGHMQHMPPPWAKQG